MGYSLQNSQKAMRSDWSRYVHLIQQKLTLHCRLSQPDQEDGRSIGRQPNASM